MNTFNAINFGLMVRASRYLLGWQIQDICTKAGFGLSTLARVESGNAGPGALKSVQRVLESAGIEFRSGTTEVCIALKAPVVNTHKEDSSMPLGYRTITDRRI